MLENSSINGEAAGSIPAVAAFLLSRKKKKNLLGPLAEIVMGYTIKYSCCIQKNDMLLFTIIIVPETAENNLLTFFFFCEIIDV